MKNIKSTSDLRAFLVEQLHLLRRKKPDIAAAKTVVSTVKEISNLAKFDLEVAKFALANKGKVSVNNSTLLLK